MPTLLLIAEIDDSRIPDYPNAAQDQLDSFRDAVLPSQEWGITLTRATTEDLDKLRPSPLNPNWYVVSDGEDEGAA